MSHKIQIALVDFGGTGVTKQELRHAAAALTVQLRDHLRPAWGLDPAFEHAEVVVLRPFELRRDMPFIGLFRHQDDAEALGYHTASAHRAPFSKVFPWADQADSVAWTTTASHELCEMVCDAMCDQELTGVDGRRWAKEVCDPCEMGVYRVEVPGASVPVSDFVLPAWFDGSGDRYSYLGAVPAPLAVNPGGYAQYYDEARGWVQVFSEEQQPRTYRLSHSGRRTLRSLASRGRVADAGAAHDQALAEEALRREKLEAALAKAREAELEQARVDAAAELEQKVAELEQAQKVAELEEAQKVAEPEAEPKPAKKAAKKAE